MARITFVMADGSERTVEADPGETLMKSALNAGLPGIYGECGGCSSCSTCKVSVDEAWWEHLPPMDEVEHSLLDDAEPGTRLSCQIVLTDDLDGITVTIPQSQYA